MSAVMTNEHWLQAFQKKQREVFLHRGFPTKKEENWKYTLIPEPKNLSHASIEVSPFSWEKERIGDSLQPHKLIFINGIYSPQLSTKELFSEGIILTSISQALSSHERLIKPYLLHEFDANRFPFAVLNNAYVQDGMFLHIPKNISISTPIQLVFVNSCQSLITPRIIIVAEDNAEISVIEEYISDTENYTNALTEIHAGNNARINHYKIQTESSSATHIANIMVNQKQDSIVNLFSLSKGAALARDDITINLAGRGTESNLLGLYLLDHDNQHIDHHLHIDHASEYGTSSMLYKGILDKKSRAVFNGKVYVHPDAQHINAYQANHNLLLSKDAEVYTKPELEIYADNVKCAHGATVGQLDAESLFYLCSRGIAHEDAKKLLLDAFADEVINKIKNPAIREYIQKRVGSYVEL